jgi:hypothetical protein
LVQQPWTDTDVVALITAIAALITALVALVALFLEGRRIRLQLGMSNMWRLIEQWDGPTMRTLRARLALSLMTHPADRNRVSDDGIDVLNTFELLGYLVVRSKTLGLEDAWINFSVWAISWWHVYRQGIGRLREEDPTVFEDYAQLVDQLLKLEADRRGLTPDQLAPTEPSLRDFLESEVGLLRRVHEEEGLTQRGVRTLLQRIWPRGGPALS